MISKTSFKKIIIALLLILAVFQVHKTYAQNSNLRKIVGENTPEFITKFIIYTTNSVETFRSENGLAAENRKVETENQTKIVGSAQHFFYVFLSFILNNPIVFYGLLLVIVVLAIRYIWHLIF